MTTPVISNRPVNGALSVSGNAPSSRRGAGSSSASGADAGRRFNDILDDDSGDDALAVPSADATAQPSSRQNVRQHRHHQQSESKDDSPNHKTDDKVNNDDSAGRTALDLHSFRERMFSPVEDVKSPRAILPPPDINQIVTAVRTDAFLNGGHEISIQLSNSVLDGLQVKLISDANGRIKAELIAPNEQAKFHLDQRSHELADMLRARGVDIAELKTSVGSHSSHDTGSQQRRENFIEQLEASRRSGRKSAVGGGELSKESSQTAETESELTYNA